MSDAVTLSRELVARVAATLRRAERELRTHNEVIAHVHPVAFDHILTGVCVELDLALLDPPVSSQGR